MLLIMIDPAILRPLEEVKREADGYAEFVRAAQPVEGGNAVQMPFDGSRRRRAAAKERGWVEIEGVVLEKIRSYAAK